MGFGSIAAAPLVNANREIVSYKYCAPKGSSLETWLHQPEIKNGFETACIATQVWIFDKEEKRQNNTDKDMDPSISESDIKLLEPDVPIFAMNGKDADNYFAPFLDRLYEMEGTKCTRKYPKVDKETGIIIAEPTPLEIYVSIADSILPRSEYFGPSKGFKPGNLTWRIKLVVCYIMQLKGIPYNTYCSRKPDDYVDRNFTIEDLQNLAKEASKPCEKVKSK